MKHAGQFRGVRQVQEQVVRVKGRDTMIPSFELDEPKEDRWGGILGTRGQEKGREAPVPDEDLGYDTEMESVISEDGSEYHDDGATFPEIPDAEDETTPQAALMQGFEWAFAKAKFRAKFKQAKFKAGIDGSFRSKISRRILMQEGSVAATWYFARLQPLPIFNGHCLVVSQDKHRIFLTMVDTGEDYLQYLEKGDAITA
ncbi:hypothetical protein BDW74DRAFT_181091 [Aspergillus multicolor]|uniref:uncharacterized protein n=1 Tax=Aspergillus multicolor TaxID=41759 RepID=UPI003CCE499D